MTKYFLRTPIFPSKKAPYIQHRVRNVLQKKTLQSRRHNQLPSDEEKRLSISHRSALTHQALPGARKFALIPGVIYIPQPACSALSSEHLSLGDPSPSVTSLPQLYLITLSFSLPREKLFLVPPGLAASTLTHVFQHPAPSQGGMEMGHFGSRRTHPSCPQSRGKQQGAWLGSARLLPSLSCISQRKSLSWSSRRGCGDASA